MGLMSEKNDIIPKNSQVAGGNTFSGNPSFYGPNKIETTNAYKTDNYEKKTTKAKKSSQSLSTMLKTFAIMVSAVLTGVAGVSVLPSSNIVAKVYDTYRYDSSLCYIITLSEYEDGLSVVLYNNFTNLEEKITQDRIEENYELLEEDQVYEEGRDGEERAPNGYIFYGEFENLQPNVTYTLAIKKGLITLTKTTICLNKMTDEYYYYEEDDYNQRPKDEYPTSDDPNGTYDPSNDDPTGEGQNNNNNNNGNTQP